jgi:rod shape-determining protein MreC
MILFYESGFGPKPEASKNFKETESKSNRLYRGKP